MNHQEMMDSQSEFIDVDRLRVGHFVFLDLGWISHPFPLNSFRIQSDSQIDTIRSLGIRRIRYAPNESTPEPQPPAEAPSLQNDGDGRHAVADPGDDARKSRRTMLAEQHANLQTCERLFGNASRTFRQVAELAHAKPADARNGAQALVSEMVDKLIGERESCIRLLSEKVGERVSLHAINVTVISLLLGKACGMDEMMLHELGAGALLHDIGKIDLPDRLRYQDEHASAAERKLYREHVAYGVALGAKMELPDGVRRIIGQHHEQADGGGYPLGVANDRLSPAARVVSLVNRYDNMCNPGNPAMALTPHETLSRIFSQAMLHFDGKVLNTFIRMMGVYPPGSLVELSDGRYALVVSVNSSRPLKPRILIHTPGIPREEALEVELAEVPEVTIRRALKALQLPRAAMDYLSPRQRICYFFERARGVDSDGGEA